MRQEFLGNTFSVMSFAYMSFLRAKLMFRGYERNFSNAENDQNYLLYLFSLIWQFKLKMEQRVANSKYKRAELGMIERPVPR